MDKVDDFDYNYRILVGAIPLLTYGTSCYNPSDSLFLKSLNQYYSPYFDKIVIKK
jgi:hypothetical protein